MQIESATFYNYALSSASYRVRIALGLKGLSPRDIKNVNLRSGEQSGEAYRLIAPSGLVPSFDFGDQAFSQSLALMEWLDTAYPTAPLFPSEPTEALKVRELALAIACDIHPLNNLRVLKYLSSELRASQDEVDQWYRHWVKTGFDGIEARLAQLGGAGPFCVGETASAADVCLVPQVFNARRFDTDLTPYPRIQAIVKHCNTLPAFAAAAPEMPQKNRNHTGRNT